MTQIRLPEVQTSRATSMAPQKKSIKLFFDFQIFTYERGPGPLSSDKIWKSKNNFIDFCGAIEVTRQGCTSGSRIWVTQIRLDSIYNI